MCGLAGFINFDNNLELASKANKLQSHRGPDGQYVWSNEYISFAHQRLAIIDVNTRSNQPLVKDDLVIIYNGELYNYLDLKQSYLSEILFDTESDTEVVLEMYRMFGTKCLDYFVGMFSFVIYNIKENYIFAARDHFGIKPFFYYQTENGFAFSSELKTLANIFPDQKEINQKALISCVNYLWIPGNDTVFKSFFKLPPAHYLIYCVSTNKLEINKYWELSTEVKNYSEDNLVVELREQFERTMKRHMISDVEVSSFLSGGLDSSLISVFANSISTNISTYTIGTSTLDKKIERMSSDEKYARRLAESQYFRHNEIIINSDLINLLPQMVRSLDEPIGDPAALNTFLICQAANKTGVKVMLSGMGADEIFCGYRRQKALLISRNYNNLPLVLRCLIRYVVNQLPVKLFGRGLRFVRWSKKFISFAEMPPEEAYRMSYSYYNKYELMSLFNENSEAEIDSIYHDHEKIFNKNYNSDLINQMCFTDINMFMVGLNLTYTDRSSMAASVEVRVPFIDKEFISFAMSIPGKFKYKMGESKYILKKVAEKFLPRYIIYRPKSSFGAPIRSWISGDLKNLVDDCLCKKQVEQRGIFNYDYIEKMIEEDRDGTSDNAYKIYQLLTLELWFREFIDK